MPAVPTGNITLLELIDSAMVRMHGKVAVAEIEVSGPDEGVVELRRAGELIDYYEDIGKWEPVRAAIWGAFTAGKLTFYVEGPNDKEQRLADFRWDDHAAWRTFLTGKLEREFEPALTGRAVYVRDDDAAAFLDTLQADQSEPAPHNEPPDSGAPDEHEPAAKGSENAAPEACNEAASGYKKGGPPTKRDDIRGAFTALVNEGIIDRFAPWKNVRPVVRERVLAAPWIDDDDQRGLSDKTIERVIGPLRSLLKNPK